MTSGLTSSGCWSGEEARQKVDLKLVSLEEISSVDNTVLQAIDLQTGTRFPRARRADRAPSPNQTKSLGPVGWTVEQGNGSTTGGGSCAYIFTSHLATATGGANNATLHYLFNTFGSYQLITTGMCTGSPGNHVRTCWSKLIN
jgi:hypothetical protein